MLLSAPGGLASLFSDVIPPQWIALIDPTQRRRHFGQIPILWAEAGQILGKNASYSEALATVQSWYQQAGLPTPKGDTSGYCQARTELCAGFIEQVFKRVVDACSQLAKSPYRGFRLKAIDGSSFRLLDTPENQKEYPQPNTQKEGCGFIRCATRR